ncbi:hypothetical protein AVEN_58669-1 [Araneus ventricosus]|uniref:Uncharacterized protein n=1 Tax=Araneus ventricosus TaxID=182803 RepID=A0A4Y2I6L6_ARAVE|nr:hypothetical protein AVEN_58669-1 [Araneus ventricosus]
MVFSSPVSGLYGFSAMVLGSSENISNSIDYRLIRTQIQKTWFASDCSVRARNELYLRKFTIPDFNFKRRLHGTHRLSKWEKTEPPLTERFQIEALKQMVVDGDLPLLLFEVFDF